MDENEIERYKETYLGSSRTPIKSGRERFSAIFIIFALLLMMLPFISTFNEFLTNLFLKWELYRILQNIVVPYEAKIIAGIMNLVGISALAVPKGVWVKGNFLEIQWNCLGWQSVVLLLASLMAGFQGKFSWPSRIEVVVIGLLGTFLINIFRLTFVGFLAVDVNKSIAIFFHDYLSLVFVLMWFFVFWWFSYSYVLEERR